MWTLGISNPSTVSKRKRKASEDKDDRVSTRKQIKLTGKFILKNEKNVLA